MRCCHLLVAGRFASLAAALWLLGLVSACDQGDILLRERSDAGAATDAPQDAVPEDAVSDAGVNVGETEDAGLLVTQPAPPRCELDESPAPFVCEGDEDICDTDGVAHAQYDVVATWSRVDGEELVVELRFRGVPFSCFGGVFILFDGAGFAGPNDVELCSNDSCREGDTAAFITIDEAYDGVGTGNVLYPPEEMLLKTTPTENGALVPGLRYARGGRLVEVRVPLALVSANGTAPSYSVVVNFSGDVNLGDGGHVLASSSLGGRADGDEPVAPGTVCVLDGWACE